jgi:hypothetical protein
MFAYQLLMMDVFFENKYKIISTTTNSIKLDM